MTIHCNEGTKSTNLIGELPGSSTVWYHQKGIANILSLSRLREDTFDSTQTNHFIVHKDVMAASK